MDCFLDAKLASSDPPALEDLEHAMAADEPASRDPAPSDASRVRAPEVHSQLSGRAYAGAHARSARPRRPLHEHDDPAAVFAAEFKARLPPCLDRAARPSVERLARRPSESPCCACAVARDSAPRF